MLAVQRELAEARASVDRVKEVDQETIESLGLQLQTKAASTDDATVEQCPPLNIGIPLGRSTMGSTNFILRGPDCCHVGYVGSMADSGYVGEQDRLLHGMYGTGDRSRQADNNSSSAYPLHYSSQSSPSSSASYTRHQTRLGQKIQAFRGSNIIPRHPINTQQTGYNRM